jgi:HSP20 family molecular chaperone IbpA
VNQTLLQMVERSSKLTERLLQAFVQIATVAPPQTRPHLWIGDWGSTPLPGIELQETDQFMVLKVALPPVTLADVTIELGAETVLIQAIQTDTAIVEGYGHFTFSSGSLHSLIPLPCAVYPELINAELSASLLILTLAKSDSTQRHRFKFNLGDSWYRTNQPKPLPSQSRVG